MQLETMHKQSFCFPIDYIYIDKRQMELYLFKVWL